MPINPSSPPHFSAARSKNKPRTTVPGGAMSRISYHYNSMRSNKCKTSLPFYLP